MDNFSDIKPDPIHLTPAQLAQRWNRTQDALYKMRKNNSGPPYVTLGRGGILYKLADVEEYEEARKTVPGEDAES